MTEFFAPSFVLGQSVVCIAIRWTSSTPQAFRLTAIIIAAAKYLTWNGTKYSKKKEKSNNDLILLLRSLKVLNYYTLIIIIQQSH